MVDRAVPGILGEAEERDKEMVLAAMLLLTQELAVAAVEPPIH